MAELLDYKCPCCGGALEFDSKTQKMKCPYCDNEFDMETLQSLDANLDTPADDMQWQTDSAETWSENEESGLRTYICNSCGGEIVADETTAATSCPFCGNPVVMSGNVSGGLKPEFIIPFKCDKNAAIEAFKKHVTGKKLLPKVFSDQNHIEEVKGIYVPFWIYDSDASAQLTFKGTRTHSWSDRNYRYTETSYYSVFRSGTLSFASVPVDGSSKMADDLMESIEPFDMNDAVDFQTAYMAGYLADKYDVSSDDSVGRANERIRNSTINAFSSTAGGYTTLNIERSTIQLQNGRGRYGLLPVWILNTKWKDKDYTFAMNGQTGKLVGDLPVDKGAYWKWMAIFTLGFGALFYGLMYLAGCGGIF